MLKRLMVLLAVLAMMVLAMAIPALADKGGVPNEKACHGQVVKAENQNGTTPHEGAAQLGVSNAGEVNKLVKSGEVQSEDPNAPSCPLEE
jgi:hypothetical protein